MKLLIIAPIHDYPTTLSNKAVRVLIKFIEAHKIEYDFLTSIKANRFYVNRKAKKNKYDGVFYYGHGQEDRLGDWAMQILPIIDKRNIHLFRDSIFYTMSCLSGKELAQIAINEGVRSYFGHNVRYFAFANNLKADYDFFDDWVKLVNYIPKRLILGDTTGAALRKYESFANSIFANYLLHDKNNNLKLLYSNALHLELFGDITATLPKS